MARIPTYAWRAAILGPAYALASALAVGLLAVVGIGDGFAPGHPDPAAVLAHLAVAGAIAGTALGLVSMRLALDRTHRWALLAILPIGVATLGLIEAVFLVPGLTGGGLIASLAGPVVGAVVLAGLAALLYGPVGRPLPGWQPMATVLQRRSGGAWLWRVGLAGLAYVPIHLAVGVLVGPGVLPYLVLAGAGLSVPGLEVILPLEVARGLGVALLAWPLVAALRGSGTRAFGWTALVLVVLAGWVPLVEATGRSLTLRVVHGLVLTAASVVHAWVIVKLVDPDARPGLLP